MSSSTVILKHPSNANNELSAKSKHQYFKFFSVCMWGLLAIITAANKEFADNVTGLNATIAFFSQEINRLSFRNQRDNHHARLLVNAGFDLALSERTQRCTIKYDTIISLRLS